MLLLKHLRNVREIVKINKISTRSSLELYYENMHLKLLIDIISIIILFSSDACSLLTQFYTYARNCSKHFLIWQSGPKYAPDVSLINAMLKIARLLVPCLVE